MLQGTAIVLKRGSREGASPPFFYVPPLSYFFMMARVPRLEAGRGQVWPRQSESAS